MEGMDENNNVFRDALLRRLEIVSALALDGHITEDEERECRLAVLRHHLTLSDLINHTWKRKAIVGKKQASEEGAEEEEEENSNEESSDGPIRSQICSKCHKLRKNHTCTGRCPGHGLSSVNLNPDCLKPDERHKGKKKHKAPIRIIEAVREGERKSKKTQVPPQQHENENRNKKRKID